MICLSGELADLVDTRFIIVDIGVDTHVLARGQRDHRDLIGELSLDFPYNLSYLGMGTSAVNDHDPLGTLIKVIFLALLLLVFLLRGASLCIFLLSLGLNGCLPLTMWVRRWRQT